MMATGQYNGNIRLALACNGCDENLLTTITNVAVDDTAENMTWTLSFFNHTAHGCNEVYFNSLVLQDPSGTKHRPAGPAMDWPGISIDAGMTQQLTLTFPFLPRSSASYTLTANLQCNHTGFVNGEFANDYGPQQITF
jgi:hypothetical protein